MVQSAEIIDSNPQRFLPSDDIVHETNSQFLMMGMGCEIIIIFLEIDQTISVMGSGRSTSLCDRQVSPILVPTESVQNRGISEQREKKVGKVRKMMNIEPGTVLDLSHMFYVREGLNNIPMVYNGTSCGSNLALWTPRFWPANCPT